MFGAIVSVLASKASLPVDTIYGSETIFPAYPSTGFGIALGTTVTDFPSMPSTGFGIALGSGPTMFPVILS